MPASVGRPAGRGQQPPEPQGRFGGLPYDWRKPSAARVKARLWNPGDKRLFTPKSFGWGFTVNLYWLRHPVRYFQQHS